LNNRLLERILEIMEQELLDLTRDSVARGNKVFGAAIIDRQSLELVVAGTNEETSNPLYHGEVSTLNRYWELDANTRPAPENCLFVSSHEPCSLCLSAITWSGFDNFYYLFTYQDSRDNFAIPHDLEIMKEVFGLKDGEYRRSNKFWTCYSLAALVEGESVDARVHFNSRIVALKAAYDELSAQYQSGKGEADIPLP